MNNQSASGRTWTSIEDLRLEVLRCNKCGLSSSRTQVVFGDGSPVSRIMIVGEAPGRDEDKSGKPFVGLAGRGLNRVLEMAGLARERVWVTNVVRCRPTVMRDAFVYNRAPRASEIKACDPWMAAEVECIVPEVIVCVGLVAGRALISNCFDLLGTSPILRSSKFGIPAVATYHPAYMARVSRADKPVIERHMVEAFVLARSVVSKCCGV